MRLLFVIPFLLMIGTGCTKNSSPGNNGGTDNFPDKIGDSWVYLVSDSTETNNQITQTQQYFLHITIVDSSILAGGTKAMVWQYQYPTYSDTNYVIQLADTIRFLDKTKSYSVRQYIYPFIINRSWVYVGCFDQVQVLQQGDVSAEQLNFSSAYHIAGNAGCPDAIFSVDEWFGDHIGLIRRYVNPFGELLATKHIISWSLEDYSLH